MIKRVLDINLNVLETTADRLHIKNFVPVRNDSCANEKPRGVQVSNMVRRNAANNHEVTEITSTARLRKRSCLRKRQRASVWKNSKRCWRTCAVITVPTARRKTHKHRARNERTNPGSNSHLLPL